MTEEERRILVRRRELAQRKHTGLGLSHREEMEFSGLSATIARWHGKDDPEYAEARELIKRAARLIEKGPKPVKFIDIARTESGDWKVWETEGVDRPGVWQDTGITLPQTAKVSDLLAKYPEVFDALGKVGVRVSFTAPLDSAEKKG